MPPCSGATSGSQPRPSRSRRRATNSLIGAMWGSRRRCSCWERKSGSAIARAMATSLPAGRRSCGLSGLALDRVDELVCPGGSRSV